MMELFSSLGQHILDLNITKLAPYYQLFITN